MEIILLWENRNVDLARKITAISPIALRKKLAISPRSYSNFCNNTYKFMCNHCLFISSVPFSVSSRGVCIFQVPNPWLPSLAPCQIHYLINYHVLLFLPVHKIMLVLFFFPLLPPPPKNSFPHFRSSSKFY